MSSGWNLPDERVEEPVVGYGPAPGQTLTQPRWTSVPRLVPLRPLGIGELLDGAFRIVREHPRQALGLAAAISAVVTLINVLLVVVVSNSPTVDGNGLPDVGAELGNYLLTSGPGTVVAFLGGLVLTGALVSIVGKSVLGEPVEPSELWQTVRSRFAALLGVALLTGLVGFGPFLGAVLLTVLLTFAGSGGVLIGVLVLLPAGAVASAYLYTRFALAPAVLVLEQAGIRQSLRRSTVLVTGAWWRTLWVLLLTVVIGVILGAILGLPLGLIATFLGDADSTGIRVAQQVLGGLGAVLISPFTAGVRALLYVDRRMRAEGLDIALAMTAAGAA